MDNGLNSGIQFRSNSFKDFKDGRVHGYQCEIDPSPRAWCAGIYDEGRRGWLYSLDKNPTAQTAFKDGDWNKVRIEAIGTNLRTWLNGIPCANILDNMTATGFIALQVHAIKDSTQVDKTVQWKNIRICTETPEKFAIPFNNEIFQANYIDNLVSDYEAKQGWKLLWDGKTTEGWRGAKLNTFPAGGWKIENGLLKVLNSGGGENRHNGTIG